MYKPILNNISDTPILAIVSFLTDVNDIYYKIVNYEVSALRVRYIEENGENE